MIVTLDFETFFSKDYTLSKLTTEAYVRDQRFEPHGVAVRAPDGEIAELKLLDHEPDMSKLYTEAFLPK